jgi:prolyl-tRNA synthetase
MLRIEGLVGRTLRARPAGLGPALGTAARAGLLRAVGGRVVFLPLGVRVMEGIKTAVCSGLGCQEIEALGDDVQDLEPALTELMRGEVQSYRQLPLRIATTVHKGTGPGWSPAEGMGQTALALCGSFSNGDGLDEFLARTGSNVARLVGLAGLEAARVRGLGASEAIVAGNANGHGSLLRCTQCAVAHLREAAPFARESSAKGAGAAMERVHTPGASTIQALAEMLGVGRERTLKALFLTTDAGDLVFAVVRGDLEVSLPKLGHVVGARSLRAATDAEVLAAGAVPGFASPIGLRVRKSGEREGVYVVADPSAFARGDFVAGANAPDFHLVHVDPSRDFSVTEVADLALAPEGARCAACGGEFLETRGTVVARTSPLPAPVYADESGREQRGAAGLVRVYLPALFEEIAGRCADDDGIAWPPGLAPADVHMVSLKQDDTAGEIAQQLERQGFRVLLDDRGIGAGAKFTDADLIGCPIRVTISSRSLQAGGAELASRKGADASIVPLARLNEHMQGRLSALMST